MTLKEKFLKSPNEGGSVNLNSCRAKNNVKIADEFAIGFVEWCLKELYTSLETGIDAKADTIEELLEVYKKEKGL